LAALPTAVPAQSAPEWRVQGLGTVAPAAQAFVGGGMGVVLRARTRLGFGLAAALGARDGNLAGRGEALLSFMLNPVGRGATGPYAAGGVAVVTDRTATNEYLAATLGFAGRLGQRTGWFVEGGLGGGLRLAAGLAFRRRTR
jgi:hypothetical protein